MRESVHLCTDLTIDKSFLLPKYLNVLFGIEKHVPAQLSNLNNRFKVFPFKYFCFNQYLINFELSDDLSNVCLIYKKCSLKPVLKSCDQNYLIYNPIEHVQIFI